MRKKTKTIAVSTAVIVLVSLAVSLFLGRKTIAIKYHKHRIASLLNEEPTPDAASGLGYYDGDWIEALEKHRDKLVEWGYLQRKEFPLEHISYPSLESRRLWEELGKAFPDNPHTTMQGYEPDTPDEIIVWARPENLPEWERIISAHDSPPTNIVTGSKEVQPQGRLSFVGHWANEDGEACYIICLTTDGSLKIEITAGSSWRHVLKNIRIQGKKIVFDEFCYLDPNEDFKSPIDRSGQHPFSGVRSRNLLEINPNDANELFHSVSLTSKYLSYTNPEKCVLTRLRQ